MTIKEMREKMALLATQARAKLDEITDKTEATRAKEIETEFDRHMADHDALRQKVERLERLDSVDAEQRATQEKGDPRAPKYDADASASHRSTPEYKEVFDKAVRFGTASLDADERSVFVAGRVDLPPEMRAQTSTTTTSGGFTVPTEFSGEIDKQMAAWGPMWDASIVRELNTSNGRTINWPTVNDTAATGRIKAQNAAADNDGTDDVVFGQRVLDAYVYDTGIVLIPMELLEDSAFDMEADVLNPLFGERLGRLANQLLTTGTGSSQPSGIVTASTLGKTAASATAITCDELIDLQHSVDPAYRQSPKCRWQFNDTTLAAIRKLKDGQGNYLWQMGDVRTGEPDKLLGHQYSVNQAMASMTTGLKTVIFGDHSKYIVRKVKGFQLITLRERYAEFFQVGTVGYKRFDGELLNTAAIKHLIQA